MPAQPGARASEARGGEEEDLRNVARETGEESVRAPEGRTNTVWVRSHAVFEDRVGGEDGAADRRADPLAGHVAREAGGVADEEQRSAGDSAWARTTDRVRVAAKRRQRQVVGKT